MALRLPPGNLASEGVQVCLPESPELPDPGVDLLKRLRIHGIDSLGYPDVDLDEAALAQRPEMLCYCGLSNAELGADHLGKTSCAAAPAGQEFQNAAPYRIPENLKSMHGSLRAP